MVPQSDGRLRFCVYKIRMIIREMPVQCVPFPAGSGRISEQRVQVHAVLLQRPRRDGTAEFHKGWKKIHANHRNGANRAGLNHLGRSEEHTSELQSRENLVCRLLLEKKKNTI